MTPTEPEPDAASAPAFAQRIESWRQRIEAHLDRTLGESDPPTSRLRAAMRYAVLGGGKRLRPVLVYVTGAALGAAPRALDAPAAAVELIHAYSLIHDDLPAMDDDDLRRGRPTCHRAFDEGTAILAGDALQALAFDVLARDTLALPDSARVAMLATLARAIGTGGMAGGQAIDIAAVGRSLGPADIEIMHRRKTGALIAASVELGALASGCTAGERLEALRLFGAEIGLAFQIRTTSSTSPARPRYSARRPVRTWPWASPPIPVFSDSSAPVPSPPGTVTARSPRSRRWAPRPTPCGNWAPSWWIG